MEAVVVGAQADPFVTLVERSLSSSYRLARAILLDDTEAEDAVQDACLVAWRQRSSLRDLDRFGPWFDRILINGCRDRLRSRRRQRVRARALQGAWREPVEGPPGVGELDAVLFYLVDPNLIDRSTADLQNHPEIKTLFPDPLAEGIRYYRKTGVLPIMHLVAMRRALVEAHPWRPGRLFRAFEQGKAIAMRRMADPSLVPLAWYDAAWDEERALLGPDPWEYGLTPQNRRTLETMIGYSHAHGLIGRKPAVEELFIDPTTCPPWKG